jgi:hypothetical protein
LYFNTTGSNNVALGANSLILNDSGNYNTALGSGALYLNYTGSYNIAAGPDAMFNNTAGIGNVALGPTSLYSNTNNSYNTAIGYGSLNGSIGGRNSALGYNAGYSMTLGTSTTFLGTYTNALANVDVSSSTAIGVGALLAKANTMVLGGTGGNSVDIVTGTSTPWAKFSIMNSYGSTMPLFDVATTTSSAYATSSLFRVSADGNVGIGTTSPSSRLTVLGNIGTDGAIPTLSSCGTSPSITLGSTDTAGEITEGTVATACTITFAAAKTRAPFCTVTDQSGLGMSYTVSNTAITITNIGALSSTKINYICINND